MSGGSQKTESKQQSNLNPFANQLLFGSATIPTINKKGDLKYPTAGMQQLAPGGIMGEAQSLYDQGPQQWYPGAGAYAPTEQNPTADAGTLPGSSIPGNTTYNPFNPMQNTAIGQGASYLGSPASLAGYDALNSAGSYLMNPGSGPAPLDFEAIMRSVGQTLPGAQAYGVPNISPIDPNSIPQAVGVGASSARPNYVPALDQVLKGEVDNPYLQQMADEQTKYSNRNFQENILPTLSTGANMAGQYGGSANAKIYANAGRDLAGDIHGRNIGLFGNAYESAQGRKAQVGTALAGQASNEAVASAANATQANLANQRTALERELADRDYALRGGELGLGYARLGSDYDLNRFGLGLDLAKAQGTYDLNRSGLLSQNTASGAGLINDASGIPLSNMQQLFGLGSLTQQDIQNQISGARDRYNFEQMAPWQNLNLYSSAFQPFMGAGGTQYGTQTTSSQLGAGQVLGGLGMMAMGSLGAGGMFGAGGAFGKPG